MSFNTQIKNEILACVPTTLSQLLPAPGTTATTRVTTASGVGGSLFFRKALIRGFRGQTTPNAGSVYIGNNASDGVNPLEILPGEERVLEAPAGSRFDWNDFFMQCVGSSADALFIFYY